ncbi:MAG: TrmH family RNA methyltransferase [Candidatus Roizmanbacteria bacterium]|nr:TrmH family RNA methyltransferase [Candidatus Roizmanbacteria bacterium]
MTRLNAGELRDISESDADDISFNIQRKPLYFILENIYDTYNIGGIFRLADALAVSKIYLCGEMETPPNHKIKKASVGTYKIVPWEYKPSAIEAIEELRKCYPVILSEAKNPEKHGSFSRRLRRDQDDKENIKIVAIEQSKDSIPYTQAEYSMPLALVLGNETYGVTPETLKAVDQIVEIPMWGVNKSLNVIVSGAIVAYHTANRIQDP